MMSEVDITKRPLVIASIVLATFMVAIEATIVATAMPRIVGQLGGFTYYSWVFSAFLLAQSTTTVIYGKLSDTFGRKPILIGGIVMFLIASALAGFAWSMASLIAFRLLQGIGAGAIQPVAMTVVGNLYKLEERAIRLPGVSGLDFQNQLAKIGNNIPIIFMTGHGDVPMSVRAMKAGATDFLTKPFRDQDVLDAVSNALALDRSRRAVDDEVSELMTRYESLTMRERQVFALVTTGLMNKQIAGELGVSEITIKIHRGRVMEKMGVRTLAELVKEYEAILPRLKT